MYIEAWLFLIIILSWFVIAIVACIGWMGEETRRQRDRESYEEEIGVLQETNGLLTRQMLQYRKALNFEQANTFGKENVK